MDLKDILAKYEGQRLATREDNPQIIKFYDSSPLEGKTLSLRSVRGPDFFKFLDYQCENSAVLIHKKADGVDAVGTISFRSGYINGRKTQVGYLGDFRIGFDRKFAREWRKSYSEVLGSRSEYFITAVIDQNLRAQNAFVKRARADFLYEKLTSYSMINVFCASPFGAKFKEHSDSLLKFSRGTPEDIPELENFLDHEERQKAFGYCFSDGELRRRLKVWDTLTPQSFYIVRDQSGIVGCFAAWSPERAKINIVERIPWYFQLARPMMKIPNQGTALHATYLSSLSIRRSLSPADRADIFNRLFRFYFHAFRDSNAHMISFCDYPNMSFHSALEGPRGFLLQKIPMTLFTVRHTTSNREVLDPESCKEPGFEISLV